MTEVTLEGWAEGLLDQIPDAPSNKEYRFSPDTLPNLPATLYCSNLVIQKDNRTYNSNWRVDHLSWYAPKETYARFALLLLTTALKPSKCELRLSNEASHLSSVFLDSADIRCFPDLFFAKFTLQSFEYWPGTVSKHPWIDGYVSSIDSLPWFCLTNRDDCVITDEQWQSRDVLTGFGTYAGQLNLATLLLDFGQPSNDQLEIELEGEGGFRGVGVHSAECSFYLPGHLAWPPVVRNT